MDESLRTEVPDNSFEPFATSGKKELCILVALSVTVSIVNCYFGKSGPDWFPVAST
jgi:hypothetical protein